MLFQDKKILLGVCGSISAYKAAYLIRLLVKQGANVQVIMTKEAKAFISPLTLSTLSKNPVLSEYFDTDTGHWNNHVELAKSADLFLIAPTTANTLAKFANGLCDSLMEAVYLSCTCPIMIAPAMDLDMWKHPSTKRNIEKLISYGNLIIRPESGELASGLIGEGRLAEPEAILEFLRSHLSEHLPLKGYKALLTAGPTYEPIDPVRYIGNHSSGKMGYALAKALLRMGAEVTLISGPSSLPAIQGVNTIKTTTAHQMYQEVIRLCDQSDILIMSAAVADYTPEEKADQKIKKTEDVFSLKLKKTKDILYELGQRKSSSQLLVGFALETQNALDNAKEKLKRKNLDLIVLNSMENEGAGFAHDTNQITIIDKCLQETNYPLKSKDEVAVDIAETICKALKS